MRPASVEMGSLLRLVLLVLSGLAVGLAEINVVMKKDFSKSGFTQSEKVDITSVHNAYRSVVKPTAANMVELVWDDEMGDLAQNWANQCQGSHRPNDQFADDQKWGESLYTRWGNVYNELRGIESWFNESYFYEYSSHNCFHKGTCNHYLALSKANTTRVGCGIKRCPAMPNRPEWGEAYFIVCNYERRVITGQKPYVSGPPCSKCPPGYPKCRYNLCVTQTMYDEQKGYNGTVDIINILRPESAGTNQEFSLLALLFSWLLTLAVTA